MLLYGDVVGMAVASGGVVGQHHVRPSFSDDFHHLGYDPAGFGLKQGPGMVVVVGPGHSGVAIAQEPYVGYSGNVHGPAHLFPADLGQRLWSRQRLNR